MSMFRETGYVKVAFNFYKAYIDCSFDYMFGCIRAKLEKLKFRPISDKLVCKFLQTCIDQEALQIPTNIF